MRKVYIVGIGHTNFGNLSELDLDLVDVMAFASTEAMDDTGIRKNRKIIDQVIAANMGGGIINHQTGIASSLVSRLDLEPAMAELIENGPASGASAIKMGFACIASGMVDVVMVTVEDEIVIKDAVVCRIFDENISDELLPVYISLIVDETSALQYFTNLSHSEVFLSKK